MGCLYWLLIGWWYELFKIMLSFSIKILIYVIEVIFEKSRKSENADFDSMDGQRFERFCADTLKNNGFCNVRLTKESGDHGIDILANNDGKKYAIQCKCYCNNVGNKAVQEAYSGRTIYKADVAVVLTNSYFTNQAISDAKSLGVELWDRNRLLKLVNKPKNKLSKMKKKKHSMLCFCILCFCVFLFCGARGKEGKKTKQEISDTVVGEVIETDSEEAKKEYGSFPYRPRYNEDTGFFPEEPKYTVNNLLLKYNEIAEFAIGEDFIGDMKAVDRPLSKATITVSNGVYFIANYNDYNNKLFVDYQEETNDTSGLYCVLRDVLKATNSQITDEDIEEMWEELQTLKYSNYYGEPYILKGCEIHYSKSKLADGLERHLIKTEYEIK